MVKRVFIIYGWDGYPEEGWFPNLKKELAKRDFKVQVPAMPKPTMPKIKTWVKYLTKIVGKPDQNTFFVGHSIGCQTILRYLESLPIDQKVGGAIFVAGWFTLINLKTKEERAIAEPWLKTTLDDEKIKKHTKKFVAIFSDNDPVVPQENQKMFSQRLGAKIIVEHGKGHFSGSDGVKKLPRALQAILEMAKIN